MADAARARRLAKRMMAIVATELQHRAKDPRLAPVTITAAHLTADLRDATIYYTVLGDDNDSAQAADALTRATGVIRSAVGRALGIKFTPTIAFTRDMVGEQSRHIEALLAAAKASDDAIAERSAGAEFAGDPQPYRSGSDDPDPDESAGPGKAAGDASF